MCHCRLSLCIDDVAQLSRLKCEIKIGVKRKKKNLHSGYSVSEMCDIEINESVELVSIGLKCQRLHG